MKNTLIHRIYLSGFIILGLSLFYYQIVKGGYYLEKAKNNYVRALPLSSIRGSIFDRNGRMMAYDKACFNIAVIPYEIKGREDKIFRNLAEFSNQPISLIKTNYSKKLKNIFSPVDILLNIEKNTALEIKEKFCNTILINSQPQRYYVYPYECAHILGYVKKAVSFYEDLKKYGYTPLERIGFSGIEQYYDAYLKGESGGELIEVNAKGKMVGFLGEKEPLRGKDIYLTIDSRLQQIAWQALKNRNGTIIILDSQNGQVLCMVSSPSFNLNDFIAGINIEQYFSDENKPLINRAIKASYPLGSIFKPLAAIAALEEKKIIPQTTFQCNGKFNLGQITFHCLHQHGGQNLYQALAHSCNIYFYHVGLLLEEKSLSEWAHKFALDIPSDIDLPYEKTGIVPNSEWKFKQLKQAWFKGDTVNLSIGQGFIEATPLQNLLAINTIASGGYLIKPYLLKHIGNLETTPTAKNSLGISQKSIAEVKKGMIDAVESDTGTAHYLKKLGLKIAGKTGTAQTRGKSHAWFIGFFPYEKPKYSICTFLENAGSSLYAVRTTYDFLETAKQDKILQ